MNPFAATKSAAAEPEPEPDTVLGTLDDAELADRVDQERMRAFAARQRMMALSGLAPAIYMVWLLRNTAPWPVLAGWMAALVLSDWIMLAHSYTLRGSASNSAHGKRWLWRHLLLHGTTGILWGSVCLLPGLGLAELIKVLLVLVAVTVVGVLATLELRSAALVHSVPIWVMPIFVFATKPNGEGHDILAGILLLLVSLHMYVERVTTDLHRGLYAHHAHKRSAERLRVLASQQQQLLECDALTGATSRREGLRRLTEALHQLSCAPADGTGPSPAGAILMLDIDHFKNVNDTWGHPAGDAVLVETVQRLRSALRPHDVLARTGGEEFLALLHGAIKDPVPMGERLRLAVSNRPMVLADGQSLPVTVSIGATCFLPGDTPDVVISRADKALYIAKQNGRDRVVLAGAGPLEPAQESGLDRWLALAQLKQQLGSGEGRDPVTQLPGPQTTLQFGQQLLACLNLSGEPGGFAWVAVHGGERNVIEGGDAEDTEVWRAIGSVLKRHLPADAFVGRTSFGFSVMVWRSQAVADFRHCLGRIRAELVGTPTEPLHAHSLARAPITSDIGFLVYPEDCGRSDDYRDIGARLAQMAFGLDHRRPAPGAMHRYSDALARQVRRTALVRDILHQALLAQRIDMVYLPLVEVRTGRIVGAEALARLSDPEHGSISPAEFVGVAETNRQIIDLTTQSMRTVMQFVADHEALLPPGARVSINLSQALFSWRDFDLFGAIESIAHATACPAQRVEFEFTESASTDAEGARQMADIGLRLRALGYAFAVDDFGSGHGALNMIVQNVASTIKLDRAAVASLLDPGGVGHAFLGGLIFSGLKNGLKVVFEGIEDQQQHREILRRGVNLAQGFYYSPPLQPAAFAALLQSGRRLGEAADEPGQASATRAAAAQAVHTAGA